MISTILIIYSILAILVGIVSFVYAISEGESTGCAVFCSVIMGIIAPVIGIFLLIIWLLTIIIPCATAIYLFG